VSEPADVWQIALSKPETTVHRLRRTEPGAVEIWWQPAADADLQGRLAAVAALFGLSLTAFLVIPFPGFARWRSQFLPFTGAVLGFVWWLWLTPSAAGLLLVLFSLLAWSASRLGRFRGRRT
jgi:hypothetical protein